MNLQGKEDSVVPPVLSASAGCLFPGSHFCDPKQKRENLAYKPHDIIVWVFLYSSDLESITHIQILSHWICTFVTTVRVKCADAQVRSYKLPVSSLASSMILDKLLHHFKSISDILILYSWITATLLINFHSYFSKEINSWFYSH